MLTEREIQILRAALISEFSIGATEAAYNCELALEAELIDTIKEIEGGKKIPFYFWKVGQILKQNKFPVDLIQEAESIFFLSEIEERG